MRNNSIGIQKYIAMVVHDKKTSLLKKAKFKRGTPAGHCLFAGSVNFSCTAWEF
jgi:hypothetical protein